MVDVQGLVARSVGTVKHRRGGKVVAETLDVVACPREPHGVYNFFLVESGGELLLVRRESVRGTQVFRVDVKLGSLIPVKTIGKTARSSSATGACPWTRTSSRLSTATASTTPTGDGLEQYGMSQMYRLNLCSGRQVNISSLLEPRSDSLRVRPFSFVQALLNYCIALPDVQAQLRRIMQPVLGITGDVIFDW
jgi:hypothetical protein